MKKNFFIIGVTVLLATVLIAIIVVKDFRQEKTLRDEIASIQKLTDLEK